MTAIPREDYLFNNRDATETDRLNWQHHYLLKATEGHLIDPSIPLQGIQNVADVATGTGIWLLETARYLSSSPSTTGHDVDQPRHFQGFDISSAQFPSLTQDMNESRVIHFSEHDMTRPFPPEHHNRYNLVHIALVNSALKDDLISPILTNVVQLLKPGGYLQWTDFSIIDTTSNVQPTPIRWMEIHSLHINAALARGFAPSLPARVESHCRGLGMDQVHRMVFSSALGGSDIELTHRWERRGMKFIFLGTMKQRLGMADTQAEEETEKLLEELEEFRQQGVALNMPIMTIVARKK